MNRERNGKLLTGTGFEVLTRPEKWRKWPDGGVVTQRTANPMPSAEKSHSSRNSPFVRATSFQGLRRSSANSPNPSLEGQ